MLNIKANVKITITEKNLPNYYYYKEHTKNKRKSNHDKHTKPRSGRDSEKKKQNNKWKPRK